MISFFYKQNSGSGEIRGRQIGEYLGAKLNPTKDYRDDVCIYVKTQPPEDYPKNTYLDILDEPKRIEWLERHPDVKVIASSLTSYEYLREKLKNEVVFIPQHHCNYERIEKKTQGNNYGVVGGKGAVQTDIEKIFPNFTWIKGYKTRQDIIEAYDKIDIQIIWRPLDRVLKNPLKIINAMSFGIPTIAYPEVAYKEIEGYYFQAKNVEDLKQIVRYNREELIDKAEEYNITNIARKYGTL